MIKALKSLKRRLVGKSSDEAYKPIPPNQEYLSVDVSDLPALSVIIPCYEMYGKGAIHLERSLSILSEQTWKNFEVVISDHSKSDLILDCSNKFKDRLDIKYFRNENFIGSSCGNANFALDNANNGVIKILFQDDFLKDNRSLENAMKYFVYSGADWMATGCNHRVEESGNIYWEHFPRFIRGQLFEALNSLGCPSVIYTKANSIRFDRQLPALMDLDYYTQLDKKYGPPVIYNEINVTIGIHDGQVTNNGGFGDKGQVAKELEIVNIKYPNFKN
jgi:hypothetical protein